MVKIDVSKVGFDLQKASLSESDFTKWCEKKGYSGDIKGAYTSLRKKAGLPLVVKAAKTE